MNLRFDDSQGEAEIIALDTIETQVGQALGALATLPAESDHVAARGELAAALAQIDVIRRAIAQGGMTPDLQSQVSHITAAAQTAVGEAERVITEQSKATRETQTAAQAQAVAAFNEAYEEFDALYEDFLERRTVPIDAEIEKRIKEAEMALAQAVASGDQTRIMDAQAALANAQLADVEDAARRGDPAAQQNLPSMTDAIEAMREARNAYDAAQQREPAEVTTAEIPTLPPEEELDAIVAELKERPETQEVSQSADAILDGDEPSAFDGFVPPSPTAGRSPS